MVGGTVVAAITGLIPSPQKTSQSIPKDGCWCSWDAPAPLPWHPGPICTKLPVPAPGASLPPAAASSTQQRNVIPVPAVFPPAWGSLGG